jgi:hypothetical protein
MNIDTNALRRAVRQSRSLANDRIRLTLNSLTYGYWREELEAFKRQDQNCEYLLDSRVQSGFLEASNVEEQRPEKHLYDCRQKTPRAVR